MEERFPHLKSQEQINKEARRAETEFGIIMVLHWVLVAAIGVAIGAALIYAVAF